MSKLVFDPVKKTWSLSVDEDTQAGDPGPWHPKPVVPKMRGKGSNDKSNAGSSLSDRPKSMAKLGRKAKLTPEQEAQIIEWAREDFNVRKLAKRLEMEKGIRISYVKVWQVIRNADITLPKPGRPKKSKTPVADPMNGPQPT